MKKDKFGTVSIVISLVLLAAALVFFVSPLEDKAAVFLMVLWLFGPAVGGAFIYQGMEKKGNWGQDQILK